MTAVTTVAPTRVAQSLRRLADLLDNDPQFAAAAADAYLFHNTRRPGAVVDVNVSLSHVTDPAATMLAFVHAANAAGIEVCNANSEQWVGVRLRFGTFDLRVYASHDAWEAGGAA